MSKKFQATVIALLSAILVRDTRCRTVRHLVAAERNWWSICRSRRSRSRTRSRM